MEISLASICPWFCASRIPNSMSSRVNLLLRRGSMKLNWFKGEWQQCSSLNWMKILMCTRFCQIYINRRFVFTFRYVYEPIERQMGMHCITIRWCLKIWQSKIVTWFSTNNNDMRSTQNNFFSFPFLFSAIDFHSHNFLRFLPFFPVSFPRKGGGGVVIW